MYIPLLAFQITFLLFLFLAYWQAENENVENVMLIAIFAHIFFMVLTPVIICEGF